MSFASKHEENQFKKWLKTSPFNASSENLFGTIAPNEEICIQLFKEEKENIKAKKFIAFTEFYADSFLNKIPNELSQEQEEFLSAVTWAYIMNKIEAMNSVLQKAYTLLDKEKKIEGLKLIQELADAGHPEACYLLAAYSLHCPIEERKPDIAFKYANKALEFVDHPRACLILAGLYYQGIGITADSKKAISYVLQAERTAQTDPSVYVLLAEYYQDGYIVHRDIEKVAYYSQKSEQTKE